MSDCSTLDLPDLVSALEARGVRLRLERGSPKISGWRRVSPAERERLQRDRHELVTLLEADEQVIPAPPVKVTLTQPEPKPTGPET